MKQLEDRGNGLNLLYFKSEPARTRQPVANRPELSLAA